jgi:hypothetical protein
VLRAGAPPSLLIRRVEERARTSAVGPAPAADGREGVKGDKTVSRPAKTIYYFALYLVGAGLTLLLFPRLPLVILGLEIQGLAWIRILGMLVLVFAYYYLNLARNEVTDFFRWTVHTRSLVPFVFAAFILFAGMSPILMLFALGDLAGAVWTARALHAAGIRIYQRGDNPFLPPPLRSAAS